MNRRGIIENAALILVLVGIMFTTAFIFLGVDERSEEISADLRGMMEEVTFSSAYIRAEAESIAKNTESKEEFMVNAKERDRGIKGSEVFFDKVERGEFEFDGVSFKMDDVNIVVERGYNKIVRKISLEFSVGRLPGQSIDV